jgi:hypothetical protein
MRKNKDNNSNNNNIIDTSNFLLSKYSGHCDICDQWSKHLYMYLKKKQYYCTECYKKIIVVKKG